METCAAKRFVFFIGLVLIHLSGVEGQEKGETPPTNLDLYGRNVEEIVDTLLQEIPADVDMHLAVRISGAEYSWIVEQAFLRTLQERDFTVRTASDESVNSIFFEFMVIELSVKYRKVDRAEAFGNRTIERSVTTALAGKMYQRSTGELHYAGTIRKTTDDFIAKNDIERVEHAQISVTQGSRPPGGFMKKILEPAVVITATAIAIYLFFSVRS